MGKTEEFTLIKPGPSVKFIKQVTGKGCSSEGREAFQAQMHKYGQELANKAAEFAKEEQRERFTDENLKSAIAALEGK